MLSQPSQFAGAVFSCISRISHHYPRLAFVRSGYLTLYHGDLRYIGEGGISWSHASKTLNYAYYLAFDPRGIYPLASDDDSGHGRPLRCCWTLQEMTSDMKTNPVS